MTGAQRQFSKRERQVVYAVLQAKPVKDIAQDLNLSANTVRDYLKTIYRKAEVHSARELMRKCHAERIVPADAGLSQLLQQAQRLSDEASPAEALAQLHGAVRACTRARRVSFWRWLRSGSELYLVGDVSSTHPGAVLRAGSFGYRLHERGWARLEVHEMGGSEGRDLSLEGLHGEVIGLECSPAPRVQVMLAGDPADGHFGPLDAAIMRLLARLIHSSSSDTGLYALSATA